MTLLRELSLYIAMLLIILLGGSLGISINDARNYHQQVLRQHAQDTATSLGVAIAANDPENIAIMDSMVDAVFDRGYYRNIRFENPEGKVLVNSEHPLMLEDVPAWFVTLARLSTPEVSTEVNHGWTRVGTLFVTSHPGHAYRNLWIKSRNNFFLFGLCLLIAITGLYVLLKVILSPLDRVERQADAICKKRFERQSKLPKTRELRRVVEAMNRMSAKLEQLFTEEVKLTEEARQHSLATQNESKQQDSFYRGLTKDQWRMSLGEVLRDQAIQFYVQPIMDKEGDTLFQEACVYLNMPQGKLPLDECQLIIEELALSAVFDRQIIEKLLNKMAEEDDQTAVSVSLSPNSLFNETFYDWLVSKLQSVPELCQRIILEIPEKTLLVAGDHLAIVISDLLKTGVRFSVDHFGTESRSLGSLYLLQLDSIKVDGSFVKGVSENKSSQLFIHTLAMLTRSRDIKLLAQNVDTQADWQQLQELGVEGGQGQWLGAPKPW